MKPRRLLALVVLSMLFAASGCGGDGDEGGDDSGDKSITFWTAEDVADRVDGDPEDRRPRSSRRAASRSKVVAIDEDQLATQITVGQRRRHPARRHRRAAARRSCRTGHQRPGRHRRRQRRRRRASGRDTFSERALELTEPTASRSAVPSDGWAQLLVYRKDLFDEGRPGRPRTPSTRSWPRRPSSSSRARTGSSPPPSPATPSPSRPSSTSRSANGCQLVDDQGNVTLDHAAVRRRPSSSTTT